MVDVGFVFSGSGGDTRVLRPAAVLDHRAAARVLAELERRDVSLGGIWSASASLWQRYDQPWNGPAGARGDSQLVGSIGVMYDARRASRSPCTG